MGEKGNNSLTNRQAEEIRKACIEAAKEGFMDASMSGLCTEGAIEAAVGAIQSVRLDKILQKGNSKKE